MRRNLLVVSQSAHVREALASRLRKQGCSVTLVATGSEALQVVRNVTVDAVLIESRRDDVPARRLRARIQREKPGCRVALVTSFAEARSTADFLHFDTDDYVLGADELLGLVGIPESADAGAAPQLGKGVGALVQVIDVVVGLLELDSSFFSGSSHRAMRLARAVAEELASEEEVVYEVALAALLRDIGKAGVDIDVLDEQGDFSTEQRELMQEHVDGSVRLLEHIDFPWKVVPVIRHHHERYDGKGYPDGLRGREIPIGARILAVVDAYLAMVSERPHRTARDHDETLEEMEREAGAQFDPEVVEVFLRVIEGHRARGGSTAKPRVLLADADAESRRLFKMKLLNEGFEVTAVSSVGRAREKIGKDTPQLVLVAPEADESEAFRLLQEMREQRSLRDVPFALLADTDDRIVKVRALRRGVDDFLVKTDDVEALVARIENIIAREARRGGGRSRRRGISGQLENMSLPDIVQTLTIGMKTARVTLTAGESHGRIWFREGKIAHAACGAQEGETAFFELVRWREGEFVIEHGVRTKRDTIDNDPMYLVLEGLRRIDHESADQAAS